MVYTVERQDMPLGTHIKKRLKCASDLCRNKTARILYIESFYLSGIYDRLELVLGYLYVEAEHIINNKDHIIIIRSYIVFDRFALDSRGVNNLVG